MRQETQKHTVRARYTLNKDQGGPAAICALVLVLPVWPAVARPRRRRWGDTHTPPRVTHTAPELATVREVLFKHC